MPIGKQVIGARISLPAKRSCEQLRQPFRVCEKYQGQTTAAAFVDALLQTLNDTTHVNLSGERANLISRYGAGGSMNESRALVVRDLADNGAFAAAVYNPSFVLMEYFGYLRRGAEPAGYGFLVECAEQ